MPNYGFAIDLRKCIGCHACTIACKAEHQIPVGVNRCWVKTVEKGTFPDTRRFFFPVLCNQCVDAPCVRICPTNALFKRRDGIVDLNAQRCIGCRACMEACPYDQLFIDPNTHTAEKCNFCANRVENRLLPACVSVCPTECRIFGDLDDPASEVSTHRPDEAFTVRKPEKGTGPKVFYLGAEDSVDPARSGGASAHVQGRASAPAADRARRRRIPTIQARRESTTTCRTTSRGASTWCSISCSRRCRRARCCSARILWWLGFDGPLTTIAAPAISIDLHLADRRRARRRSREARALLLHPDAIELAIVAGVGRVVPDRARHAQRPLAAAGMVRLGRGAGLR